MISLIAEAFPPTFAPALTALDYLGYTPCALQKELRIQLDRLLQGSWRANGEPPEWVVPVGCGEAERYKDIWRAPYQEELPDLISDFANGDYLGKEFRAQWIDAGVYGSQESSPLRAAFRDAGLADPEGIFHVYGVLPYIILADLQKLGNRPLPRHWGDLLDPMYRGDLIIGGAGGRPGEVILYNFHKEFGTEGLAALGANVKTFWHGAQMAKAAGSGHPDGAALYVLPWFLAINNPHPSRTALVWPEDGVLSLPLYWLAKRNADAIAEQVAGYLGGPDWAKMISRIGFAAHPGAAPISGKLKWLGWDYLRENDWEAMREPLGAAFKKGRGT